MKIGNIFLEILLLLALIGHPLNNKANAAGTLMKGFEVGLKC